MVIFAVLSVFWLLLVHCWYTVGKVLVDMWRLVHQWSFLCCFDCFLTIGTPLVHWLYSLGRPVMICTPMVLSFFDDWYSIPFAKKQSKDSQTAKMTIGVPIVTCLHRVRRIHKAAQTPLPCETCITCTLAVATAHRLWAGLIVCVYTWRPCASGFRSLPRAATLSSTYWW